MTNIKLQMNFKYLMTNSKKRDTENWKNESKRLEESIKCWKGAVSWNLAFCAGTVLIPFILNHSI